MMRPRPSGQRIALPIVALALIAGCSFESRSDDFRCAVPTDCSDGRECIEGFCVVPGGAIDASTIDADPNAPDADPNAPDADPNAIDASTGLCPPACDSCSGLTCIIACDTDAACAAPVVCPAGYDCQVSCGGTGACEGGVDCSAATACSITCGGEGSCDLTISCGTGACDARCTGNGSCAGGIDCSTSCACTTTCSGSGSCATAPTCRSSQCTTAGGDCRANGGCNGC